MQAIKNYLNDLLAYRLARTKMGYRVNELSENIEKYRNSDDVISMMVTGEESKAKLRQGVTQTMLQEELLTVKDPRYVHNPLYRPKKHKQADGHYLFDEAKKPVEPTPKPNTTLLRKRTLIVASGIEFVLDKNTWVIGSFEDASKVMADQADRYKD